MANPAKPRKPAHRATTPRAAEPTAARAAANPLVTLVVLKTVLGHFGSTLGALKDAFGTPPVRETKPLWRSYIPQLARAAADMIELEPRLFAWLSFTAGALRYLESEVLLLTEVKSFLDGLTLFVSDLLSSRRDDLYRKTTEVTSGLAQGLASPLTPAETRRRLEEISEAVLAMVDEQNTSLRNARLSNKGRIAEAQADVERLQQENAVLRGDAAVTTALAPRRARRPRRTSRR